MYLHFRELICRKKLCILLILHIHFSADNFYDNSYWNDFRVNIDSSGHVVWAYGGTLSTLCLLDVRRFPFDSQQCEIEFINWAYTGQFDSQQCEIEFINWAYTGQFDSQQCQGEFINWAYTGQFDSQQCQGEFIDRKSSIFNDYMPQFITTFSFMNILATPGRYILKEVLCSFHSANFVSDLPMQTMVFVYLDQTALCDRCKATFGLYLEYTETP